jgi:hypothetical protein
LLPHPRTIKTRASGCYAPDQIAGNRNPKTWRGSTAALVMG